MANSKPRKSARNKVRQERIRTHAKNTEASDMSPDVAAILAEHCMDEVLGLLEALDVPMPPVPAVEGGAEVTLWMFNVEKARARVTIKAMAAIKA